MDKYSSLLAMTLLLAGSYARAADDRSDDLRYCLDLPSDLQIAKCAGEVSPVKKGRPFSRQEVEGILSREKAGTPASEGAPSVSPAPAGDKPEKDALPEKSEINSN